MKLRIEQRTLADAAKHAFRRLPGNPVNPVLAGLLIDAPEDGPVHLSGFDLETATQATLDADVLEAGKALVSGRLLADVAAALPAGPVDLIVDDHEVTLAAPGTTFTLPTMEHRDYPALPTPPGAAGSVDGAAFAAAVVHAASAAMPPKEAVGTMEGFSGVHVLADGDELVVSASDRYRIVRHRIPWTPDGDADGELLLPADGIAVTAKQMAGAQVRIAFPSADGAVAALATDRLTTASRTIGADFPNINGFFPDPAKAVGWIGVGAAELLEAAKRAALVNDNGDQAVVFTVDSDVLTVSGGAHGNKGASRLEVMTEGVDGFTAGYRPGFLSSLLAPIDGPARIWFTTPNKPVLIEPVDDATYRAVCMPVRLK
ncbi:DNA polymerase III subunit beta [Streptomyces sp. NBC_01353]|uniref:DNA polymerase III subunit beta n=1 Tax=Streptomyces sp. NBC_01353 TaxID=2903835 RepID=UPI002E2EBA8C|nr:DNA polymerase III subunit beta [Streptomyces sp. NBC_01353]